MNNRLLDIDTEASIAMKPFTKEIIKDRKKIEKNGTLEKPPKTLSELISEDMLKNIDKYLDRDKK